MQNRNLFNEPMVVFHKFFDGEDITQQDPVACIQVNVGMHYVVRVFPYMYLDVYGRMYLFSRLLKIRLTPRPQPLLPGIILYLNLLFAFH